MIKMTFKLNNKKIKYLRQNKQFILWHKFSLKYKGKKKFCLEQMNSKLTDINTKQTFEN